MDDLAAKSKIRHDFASDNIVGLAPEALAALVRENSGAVRSYGFDLVCERTADLIRAMLDADAEIRFLFAGTAANAIALAMLAAPYDSVLAHPQAHILVDENSAPAFFGNGLTIEPIEGPSALIEAGTLAQRLAMAGTINRPYPAALSVTQASEYGAVYDEEQLRQLCVIARSAGLRIHVDGARLANAAAAGFDLKALAPMGVDTLVFGGAKPGAGCVEALVIFDKSLARRIDNRLKQAGQVASKARTQVAPLLGLLETGAWLDRARHANAMAALLAEGIRSATDWSIVHPVQSNTVFVDIPEAAYRALIGYGWQVFRFGDGSTRFVCNWATTKEAVGELLSVLRTIAGRSSPWPSASSKPHAALQPAGSQ